MVIALLPAADLLVKTRVRRDIDLAPENRLDAVCLRLLIKVNHTVHDAVVCDRGTVHAKLLDTLDILLNLVGAVEQTVLCMYVQMCKCHSLTLLPQASYSSSSSKSVFSSRNSSISPVLFSRATLS